MENYQFPDIKHMGWMQHKWTINWGRAWNCLCSYLHQSIHSFWYWAVKL